MSWVIWLGVVAAFLLWCWWRDRQDACTTRLQDQQEALDFSIHLYASKRGQSPRFDR